MIDAVHTFDNGVKVYNAQLIPAQRKRYRKRNVHEAEEEDVFVAILRSIPSDGLFVNIGAGIGYYPILAKKLAPLMTVHAVEPLERHRSFLHDNLALNGLNDRDVVVHEEGVCGRDGWATFLDKGYGSAIRMGSRSSDAMLEIRTRTLDSLCTEIGRIVDLCQMDVQGLELDVLKGATRTLATGAVRVFLIGTHSEELHGACSALLERSGYGIAYDNYNTTQQPDGILVACKGCRIIGLPTRAASP